jgi:integrase/recombinase XerD
VTFMPCLVRSVQAAEVRAITLGHPLVDDYLAFVGARARMNTWLATAYDLKVFFTVVGKDPAEVTRSDVFMFLAARREPRRGERVVRLEDGEAGLAARTIARRLSSVSGLFAYLAARGDVGVKTNPVPRGLAARRPGRRGAPLIRTPRTLPRVLSPGEVDALVGALRTQRDRAMVQAMLFGGLRRCEVLGLRLVDVNVGERRLFITEGKGGRQRIVPVSAGFFAALGEYLADERPHTSTTEKVTETTMTTPGPAPAQAAVPPAAATTPPHVAGWPPYPGEAKLGDRGEHVRTWQRILIQAGAISDIPRPNRRPDRPRPARSASDVGG